MKKKSFFSFGIIIVFLVLGFFLINQSSKNLKLESPQNIKYVQIGGVRVKVNLALDSVTQARGLSGKVGLAENFGLLFIFDKPGKYPFWMRDMNFSIDIIWLSEENKIIFIKKDATPESYPEFFGPDAKTKYVLEVSAGFSDKNSLKIGDFVQFF